MTTAHQRMMAIIKGSPEEREELGDLFETNHAAYNRLVLKIWNEKVCVHKEKTEGQ
jgi:hypothetical protein